MKQLPPLLIAASLLVLLAGRAVVTHEERGEEQAAEPAAASPEPEPVAHAATPLPLDGYRVISHDWVEAIPDPDRAESGGVGRDGTSGLAPLNRASLGFSTLPGLPRDHNPTGPCRLCEIYRIWQEAL